MARSLQHMLLGRPLPTTAMLEERLTRPRAIGAFGLDALSSVAYAPDEILYALLLAGAAATRLSLPIAVAITALLLIVTVSYRQTIFAYPHGGGSFTVARENLGRIPGLVAAAALMVDYLTVVAVSVTAGVQAIVAFVPALDTHRVSASVAGILLLMVVNLRGIREAGAIFVLPTYLFIGSLGALVVWGLLRVTVLGGVPQAVHAAPPPAVEALTPFLVLHAFAGGCTAMTGIEAIANGVPAFKRPEARNAATTLSILAGILAVLFLGVTYLGQHVGAVPTAQANVVAQVGRAVADGPLFYLVQLSAAVVLLLAANTSFNGFPLLAATIARDGYFPHQFTKRGQRLAYSNGIIVIGALAIALVVVFRGSTHALIPLFAVGVFLCFTLSQAGMVRHWRRTRGPWWRVKLAVNGIGALATGLATIVVVVAKFAAGAWLVVLLVPLLVLNFLAIHAHYQRAREELANVGPSPEPHDVRHRTLIPVHKLNRATAEAVRYALSASDSVIAVHIDDDGDETRQLQRAWQAWCPSIPLRIVPSPYREVLDPLVDYILRVQAEEPRQPLTVMVPEVIPHRWWEEPLHNQSAFGLELALRYKDGIVVTTVPIRLHR